MTLFAILGVLLLESLIILLTHSYRPNIARSWVIAMVTGIVAWVAAFVLRLYLPTDISF